MIPGFDIPIPQAQIPDGSGIAQALAQNAELGQRQALMAAQEPRGLFGGGIGNVLGRIGDALLVANGHQPMYAPKAEARRKNQAIRNYLGQLDPELAALIGSGLEGGTAVDLYKLRHPKPEGQPSFVQEFLYRQGLDPDAQKAFDAYADRRKFNPFMAPARHCPDRTCRSGRA